ncbi:hypothetical protein GGI07_001663 [Coemansia sp. Benny D115]|nr:hypothetical protein GGI07_001663 [Coemansia sp. Benny D115]
MSKTDNTVLDASAEKISGDSIHEHIASPLSVISKLFDSHRSTLGADTEEEHDRFSQTFGKTVQAHFAKVFDDQKAVDQIPILSQVAGCVHPKVGTLVRFRCMVQDPSYGEQLHLAVAQLVNTTTGETKQRLSQYTDTEHALEDGWEVDYSSPDNIFTEREVAYCVSVPGITEWADLNNGSLLENAMASVSISKDPQDDICGPAAKYPLGGQKHSAALIKFYAPVNAPKVSSVVDVIGVYEMGYDPRDQPDTEELAQWPCLHAILCNEVSLDSLVPSVPSLVLGEYGDRQAMCLSYLTLVLGGDDLAARYLLLHLLSRTVAVQDAKVGKFSLNLIGFPSGSKGKTEKPGGAYKGGFALGNPATKRVADALSQLVPRCVEVPFELEHLNKTSFLPNAESGDLRAGALQLAHDTQVICDETCMHEGTLEERGVRNLHALQTAILEQTITYVYPFQPIEMATNLRFLVLSPGKSILQNDCDLYLTDAASHLLSQVNLGAVPEPKPLDPMHTEQLRQYLEQARGLEFSVPGNVSERISEEYAEMRKRAHESKEKMMSQEELAVRVTVARLVSIGKGEGELTWESWTEACDLERRREERNKVFLDKKAAAAAAAHKAASAPAENGLGTLVEDCEDEGDNGM